MLDVCLRGLSKDVEFHEWNFLAVPCNLLCIWLVCVGFAAFALTGTDQFCARYRYLYTNIDFVHVIFHIDNNCNCVTYHTLSEIDFKLREICIGNFLSVRSQTEFRLIHDQMWIFSTIISLPIWKETWKIFSECIITLHNRQVVHMWE